MKKLTALILSLCMLCALGLAAAETAAVTEEMLALVGTWDVYIGDALAGTIEFRADGTYGPGGDASATAGTWSAADGIFVDGEEAAPYTLEDGVLTIHADVEMVLRRIETTEEAGEAAPLDEALFGTWSVENLADLMGEMVTAMGIQETMTFSADGTLTVTATAMGNTSSQTFTWTAQNNVLTTNGDDASYTIENGVMTLDQDGIIMVLRLLEE